MPLRFYMNFSISLLISVKNPLLRFPLEWRWFCEFTGDELTLFSALAEVQHPPLGEVQHPPLAEVQHPSLAEVQHPSLAAFLPFFFSHSCGLPGADLSQTSPPALVFF